MQRNRGKTPSARLTRSPIRCAPASRDALEGTRDLFLASKAPKPPKPLSIYIIPLVNRYNWSVHISGVWIVQ
jgi:hypothetical protein